MIRRAYSGFWAVVLSVLLLLPPLPPRAYAPPPDPPLAPLPVPGPGNTLSDDLMQVDAAPEDIAEATAVDGTSPEVTDVLPVSANWQSHRDRILADALEIRRRGLAVLSRLEAEKSADEVTLAIEKGQVVYEDATLGKAEVT